MIYINGIAGILPSVQLNDKNYHAAVDPDYALFLNPAQMRRMSRLMQMGLWTGKAALQHAGVQVPDAIITATALGANEDTEKFLRSYIGTGTTGSPTAFIQSTHNAVGGQLALALACTGYNMTYSQRAFSFESGLADAALWLTEHPGTVLCGAMDEVTTMVTDLFHQSGDKGFPAGEAAVFFVLGSLPGSETTAGISEIILETVDEKKFVDRCNAVFVQKNLNAENTVIFTGNEPANTVLPEGPYPVISVLPETGYFPTFTAVALYKALDYLKQHPTCSYAAVIAAEGNKYFRMILVESYKRI